MTRTPTRRLATVAVGAVLAFLTVPVVAGTADAAIDPCALLHRVVAPATPGSAPTVPGPAAPRSTPQSAGPPPPPPRGRLRRARPPSRRAPSPPLQPRRPTTSRPPTSPPPTSPPPTSPM